jgi:hypothetical protein
MLRVAEPVADKIVTCRTRRLAHLVLKATQQSSFFLLTFDALSAIEYVRGKPRLVVRPKKNAASLTVTRRPFDVEESRPSS